MCPVKNSLLLISVALCCFLLFSSLKQPTTKGISNPYVIDELEPVLFPKEYIETLAVEIYKINEQKIPILMYHSIDNPKYWIDTNTFRNHLELLNKAGFSTIKMEDYLKNDFTGIPEGRKPIILTFDDQWASQFFFTDQQGTKISKNCVVGILEEFAKQHPAFGKKAVFYLFFHRLPFIGLDQDNLWSKKINYLLKNDFEIGCHTYDHSIMTNMAPNQIKREFDLFFDKLIPLIKDYLPLSMTLAYPGGNVPKNKIVISQYSYRGIKIKASFVANGGFAKVPAILNSGLYSLPRIEGSSKNIHWLIQQKTYQKQSKIIKIPKMFTGSNDRIEKWLQTNSIWNNNHFFYELN